jgi:DNA-binding response OmpR family regulator
LAAPGSTHGLRVEVVDSTEQLLATLASGRPDLVVMDMDGPAIDPVESLRTARAASTAPIIVLASAADEIDQIVAFELGADDYATKPLTGRLLLARMKSRLRRSQPQPAAHGAARLRLDPAGREVSFDGRPIELPPSEFVALRMLVERAGRVVTRSELAQEIGDASLQRRSIDSTICRLRKHLLLQGAQVEIRAVTGAGYRLRVEPASEAGAQEPRELLAA